MQDLLGTLGALHRPPLLIRAARIGLEEYRREVHLRKYMSDGSLPRSALALIRLLETEAILERERQTRAMGYSPARHVDVLIAMMGEARQISTVPVLAEV